LIFVEGITNNAMTNEHNCTSSGRRQTTTPTTSWVAALALLILAKKSHICVPKSCRPHSRIHIVEQFIMKQCGRGKRDPSSIKWNLRRELSIAFQVEGSYVRENAKFSY
jgi:hypothetical protein